VNRQYALSTVVLLCLICLVARAQEPTPATEKRQPQSAVAAKQVTFGTLATEDPKVKAATRADDLPAAKQLVGKSGSFQGTVVRVYAPSSNSVVLLDFARFPDLATVKGKRVLVTGKVSEFKGQPQVDLTRPDDLKIIK